MNDTTHTTTNTLARPSYPLPSEVEAIQVPEPAQLFLASSVVSSPPRHAKISGPAAAPPRRQFPQRRPRPVVQEIMAAPPPPRRSEIFRRRYLRQQSQQQCKNSFKKTKQLPPRRQHSFPDKDKSRIISRPQDSSSVPGTAVSVSSSTTTSTVSSKFSTSTKDKSPKEDTSPIVACTERDEIEVVPGVYAPLHGSEETIRAMRNDNMKISSCPVCTMKLYCIDIATYTLCPMCQTVSTASDAVVRNKRSDPTMTGGVGLAITEQEYQEWCNWQNDQDEEHPSAAVAPTTTTSRRLGFTITTTTSRAGTPRDCPFPF